MTFFWPPLYTRKEFEADRERAIAGDRMARHDPDNPPYVTVTRLNGSYHINKMAWDKTADAYQVVDSKGGSHSIMDPQTELEAQEWARKWAAEEGLEVR